MVAYSFQERFIAPIQAGTKRQTIRAIGKRRHAVKHDRIQLYTGMRTARCRKIVEPDPICTGIRELYINVVPLTPSEASVGRYVISDIKIGENFLDREECDALAEISFDSLQPTVCFLALYGKELDAFAKSDGFNSLEEMADFFGRSYGPGIFRGVLITWRPTS